MVPKVVRVVDLLQRTDPFYLVPRLSARMPLPHHLRPTLYESIKYRLRLVAETRGTSRARYANHQHILVRLVMPGAGKQTPEVQARIKELLEAGFDPTTIHRRLKVGRSSIYRMKRNLEEHGSAYMPVELNKKNGRPKVLSPEQELAVRDWLQDPKNRSRYLDDLVWLIHDRFGIICSTTTMSKLKRKWLRVIESQESGVSLDDATRQLVMETHPDLDLHLPTAAAADRGVLPPPFAEEGHRSAFVRLAQHDVEIDANATLPRASTNTDHNKHSALHLSAQQAHLYSQQPLDLPMPPETPALEHLPHAHQQLMSSPFGMHAALDIPSGEEPLPTQQELNPQFEEHIQAGLVYDDFSRTLSSTGVPTNCT